MSVTINLTQCRELLEQFGGEDTEISIEYIEDGHSGAGLYAWPTDYPDEGSTLLGEADPSKAERERALEPSGALGEGGGNVLQEPDGSQVSRTRLDGG